MSNNFKLNEEDCKRPCLYYVCLTVVSLLNLNFIIFS